MSAFEQRVDDPPDKAYQYMLVAADPYETCGFKLQAREIDRSGDRYWTWWDADLKEFWVQVMFLTEREERYVGVPRLTGSIGGMKRRPTGGGLVGVRVGRVLTILT
ncbi:hypothetical protein EKO27_g3687 [Xylaria grammica]|uniref:SF3A2 domain-containing protein n=1 Tax=Xylaria grammica TaxID=363999 RepID=A0A439DAK4_9PEZI|nr:hypothetical protein EKO27_g3687 [Xylaria grammica]